jgi:hypothetical protein
MKTIIIQDKVYVISDAELEKMKKLRDEEKHYKDPISQILDIIRLNYKPQFKIDQYYDPDEEKIVWT